jgi:hypothetical protein
LFAFGPYLSFYEHHCAGHGGTTGVTWICFHSQRGSPAFPDFSCFNTTRLDSGVFLGAATLGTLFPLKAAR